MAPWLNRFILLLPIMLFALIGIPHALHPVESLGMRGIAFTSGFGVTTARIGFGAFPLGLSVFLLGCALSERYLLVGFNLVATMDTVALVTRILGMKADASVQGNMPLVGAEVILLIVMGAGIVLERNRRASMRESLEPAYQKEAPTARQADISVRNSSVELSQLGSHG